jgi:non-specific protein-tyrosine kinase
LDYLYKAIQKEMGVALPEQPPQVEPEERPAAQFAVAASAVVPEMPSIATPLETPLTFTASMGGARSVEFPMKSERLYCQRAGKMSRGQRHALEQIRVLRSRVLEMTRSQNIHSLMVTSAVAGEFKTTTSINLALALSQVQGVRVCLVDTDMRKAGIADALGIAYERGLHDYLQDTAPIGKVLLRLTESLCLVPSGGTDENSAEILHSETMASLVQELKKAFDLVIYDAPPLFPVADARILANLVDGALFCVRAGHTPDSIIQEAMELIRPKVMGAVLVGADVNSSGWYYYEHKASGKE